MECTIDYDGHYLNDEICLQSPDIESPAYIRFGAYREKRYKAHK